jgi:beta-glucosidase
LATAGTIPRKLNHSFPLVMGFPILIFLSANFPQINQAIKNETIHAKFTIKNTGSRSGAEVVQLYVSDPVCSVLRPEKELKAFKKVFLQPGETKTVELDVKVGDLAFYDETKKAWNTEAGEYILQLGNSSRNISKTVKIWLNKLNIHKLRNNFQCKCPIGHIK